MTTSRAAAGGTRPARDARCRLNRYSDPTRRHNVRAMATHPSHPEPLDRLSLAQLIVRQAHGDLLDVEPLDLGPGAPATAALERERGPEPEDVLERGDD
jgi:hypothetical protein